MTRQVVKPSGERGIDGGGGDAYMERLIKLIPGETVAMYLFLQGVIQSGLSDQEGQLKIWLWVIVGILAAGNLFYLKKSTRSYGCYSAQYFDHCFFRLDTLYRWAIYIF